MYIANEQKILQYEVRREISIWNYNYNLVQSQIVLIWSQSNTTAAIFSEAILKTFEEIFASKKNIILTIFLISKSNIWYILN